MNYHELTAEQKTAMKAILTAIRKVLYDDSTEHSDILHEGLTINFGKGDEERFTVKVEVVA